MINQNHNPEETDRQEKETEEIGQRKKMRKIPSTRNVKNDNVYLLFIYLNYEI